jgi:hypothetical protein
VDSGVDVHRTPVEDFPGGTPVAWHARCAKPSSNQGLMLSTCSFGSVETMNSAPAPSVASANPLVNCGPRDALRQVCSAGA